MYKIIYYETENGENPVWDFLKKLEPKASAKIQKYVSLLSIEGSNLKRPYADYLKEGIYELRVRFSPNNYRVLYFFFSGENIILTNGFIKKTDAVPEREILKALKHKLDYEKRY